jgi:hypothetical protein
MRFILIWNDENDFERNVRRVADTLEDCVRGVYRLLDGISVYDEEKAGQQFYEDSLKPAVQALLDEVAGDNLATFLATMRTGDAATLRCEGGTFEVMRCGC